MSLRSRSLIGRSNLINNLSKDSPQGFKYASLVVFFVTLLVFANCLQNTFVWDDEQFVVKNAFLKDWKLLPKALSQNIVAGAGLESNLYRPLQTLTHFMDLRLWGSAAWGHHFTNVLLYSLAAVFFFKVMLTLAPFWPAILATLLFVLHPIQSESVAYISGRGDILAILFMCLGFLSFRKNLWLTCLFSTLAMASKESMALFPLFLFLYDRAQPNPAPFKKFLAPCAASAFYVLSRLTFLNFKNTLNFYDQPNILTENFSYRFYTYLTTIPKALQLWLFPYDLHHERSWSVFINPNIPKVWLSFGLVATLLFLAFFLWKKHRLVSIGILWFFLATIPTSNLLVLINALFYDHWFILPGMGLIFIAAHALSKKSLIIAGFLIAALLAGLTVKYNAIWRDPISLYPHILKFEPRSAKIANNLAMAYADEGQTDEAIRLYNQAIAISDEFPHTHHNLANIYLSQGREDLAVEELKKAIALNPNFHYSLEVLGLILLKHNQLQEAKEILGRCNQVFPYSVNSYLALAEIARIEKRPQNAVKILETGLQRIPNQEKLKEALARMKLGQ